MRSRCQAACCLIRALLLLAAVQIIAASAFAQRSPASASPTPQASPTPSLERQFFKNILRDQRAIWTSPLHLVKRDARWLLPLGITTAALIATDPQTGDFDEPRNRTNNVSRDTSYLGAAYTTAAITGTFYLVGRAKKNARARETGLLGAEALLNGHIVTLALKTATQRPRPREKDGRGEFFEGGRSFPSGHTIMAWSLATVIAEEYRDRPFVRFSAYGLAAAVSAARYTGRNHFLSDVLVGSAIGYGIGRYVYRTRHNPNLDPGGEEAETTNDTERSGLVPFIIPRYHRQARAYGLTLAWSF
jgi:membrane-associated phospholipid phosphatase